MYNFNVPSSVSPWGAAGRMQPAAAEGTSSAQTAPPPGGRRAGPSLQQVCNTAPVAGPSGAPDVRVRQVLTRTDSHGQLHVRVDAGAWRSLGQVPPAVPPAAAQMSRVAGMPPIAGMPPCEATADAAQLTLWAHQLASILPGQTPLLQRMAAFLDEPVVKAWDRLVGTFLQDGEVQRLLAGCQGSQEAQHRVWRCLFASLDLPLAGEPLVLTPFDQRLVNEGAALQQAVDPAGASQQPFSQQLAANPQLRQYAALNNVLEQLRPYLFHELAPSWETRMLPPAAMVSSPLWVDLFRALDVALQEGVSPSAIAAALARRSALEDPRP